MAQFKRPNVLGVTVHDQIRAQISMPCSVPKYPLTVRVEPGESLRGYIHRLAHRNAFPTIRWICSDLGIRSISAILNETHLGRLSVLSRAALSWPIGSEQGATSSTLLFEHKLLATTLVDHEASRLCLECFRKDGVHRLAWDVSALTICPFHHTPIIRNCPECGTVLRWQRKNLHECPAGHCLVGDTNPLTPNVTEPVLDVMRAIYEYFEPNPSWPSRLYMLPSDAASLSLPDFVDALDTLGSVPQESRTRDRRGKHGTATGDFLALARGFRALRDWPNGFYELLDAIPGHNNGLTLADVTSPWRRSLHRRLAKIRNRAFAPMIAREIWNYAEARGVSLTPGAFGFTPDGFDAAYISGTTARDLMKVSMPMLKRIAIAEGWIGAQQLLTRKATWLRHSDVDGWLKENPARLSIRQLSKRFHVSPKTILELARLGAFGEEAAQRKTTNHRSQWYALPREAERLSSRIVDAIKPKLGGEDTFYVTWNGFAQHPESRETSFAVVVEGVLNGTVRANELKGEDLGTLRFHMIDAMIAAATPGKQRGLDERIVPHSVRTMASRHRVQHLFIRRAIKLGILSAHRRAGASSRYWLTLADMGEFLERFTTTGLVARRISVSTKAAEYALKALGLRPRYDSTRRIDPAIYSWDDIRRIGLPKLAAAARKKQRLARARGRGHRGGTRSSGTRMT